MRPLPLDTLRAFDAAFRAGSFTRAGEILHLTHGAVSRQVAQLEQSVGVSLFRRVARGLRPTPAGERLHKVVRRSLRDLEIVSAELRAEAGDPGRVRVSVLPSFGARWLLPRMPQFAAAYPGIEIELVAENRLVDLSQEGFDLGVRYGEGHWPGLTSRLLMAEQVFPVCSPALAERFGDGADPGRLQAATLLHDGERPRWGDWLRAAGLDENIGRAGLTFNDYNLLVEAALSGLGVGFGRSALILRELESGRLIAPFPLKVPSDWSYYLIAPEGEMRPAAATFAAWLHSTVDLGSSPDKAS
jgi:LysR family glycine cleavage system transcriptional activator